MILLLKQSGHGLHVLLGEVLREMVWLGNLIPLPGAAITLPAFIFREAIQVVGGGLQKRIHCYHTMSTYNPHYNYKKQ